ncbi:MAG: TolC family protein [Bacteroidales bacterium]|nr:TolC family protein [Lentimicrobiaceae bacterium]MDD5694891.1 TolC family protein [Bacteroidales bacterium]
MDRHFKKRTVTSLRLLAFSILLFCSSCSFGQSATVLNLDSCYAMAERNFPLIKQYDLIEKTKEYTISNASKAYLPQISITGIGAYIISGLPSIQLPNMETPEKKDIQFIGIGQINQTLWDGGATRTQKEVATASAGVENATVDVSLYELHERVDQLYFGILLIDEQLKQLSILNDNLTRSLNSAKLTKDQGLTYQTDVDEVKSELLNVGQKQIEFDFTRKGYLEMLSFLVGRELAESVRLEIPVALESNASLSNNRPELNLYANQLRLIEASSAFDKVSIMPKFGVMGAGIFIEPGISFATETLSSLALAGLSVTWNTKGLYKFSNNKKLDQVKMDRIRNQQEIFLFNTDLQLKQIQSEIDKQKVILRNDDDMVLLRGDIRNGYQLKYDNGLCSMNELINAINSENEARSTRALHQMQLLMSLCQYKTKTGH